MATEPIEPSKENPPPAAPLDPGGQSGVPSEPKEKSGRQDNFVEGREPAELIFCIILASAYAGLAKYCWEPLVESKYWLVFFKIEGIFITIGLLALVLGLRPYLSPSSLQISRHGIKYRGPYWPQRKTVNWSQIFQMYVSPELIFVLYRPKNKPKSIRLLLIHSMYLADREQIADSIVKYSPIEPTLLASPGWLAKLIWLIPFALVLFWIVWMLLVSATHN